ncbi:hypothetical protein AB0E55_36700 [Amycolatopsis keratiniphila]|uniref:hypothetical protein n=1 Tax=Amycolatopsis keratiniphila TaxID=129921 RepID=UPI0033F1A877
MPVTRVALPVHAHNSYGHALLPPLMRAGTYAVDPEPFGPPWRAWDESEAEARRLFAPVFLLSDGPAGSIVVAPGDTRGTVLIPERCDGYCYGVDGRSGPNLACASCGLEVGTRIDDCSRWQEVRFAPDSVRFEPSEESLADDWIIEGLPPVEPSGAWSPYWEAAVGDALAHLFAVSGAGRSPWRMVLSPRSSAPLSPCLRPARRAGTWHSRAPDCRIPTTSRSCHGIR